MTMKTVCNWFTILNVDHINSRKKKCIVLAHGKLTFSLIFSLIFILSYLLWIFLLSMLQYEREHHRV